MRKQKHKADGGFVSLVGAGPGDPKLMTQKGLERLRLADLVLYDALVHPSLLKLCRSDAEVRFVGKRAGRPQQRQQQINEQLLEAAVEGRCVVRLKGGDPYLFGRGSEEAEFLAQHHIRFEVVPGVPSPLAAGAYAGLSLTHRHVSSSVAYLTATESPEKDRSQHDWAKLATATQTLVIFMGMRRIEALMKLLVRHGRPAQTPAAVVQWASLPTQRVVVGTLANIANRAMEADVGLPALIIVGGVVELRRQLRWYDQQPTFGKRVVVTRPAAQAEGLEELLLERGAHAIHRPLIRIAPPLDPHPLAEAVKTLHTFDWLVLTSRNGVDALWREVRRQRRDARAFGSTKICCIGPKTSQAFADLAIHPDLMPEEFVGEALVEQMKKAAELKNKRILLPRTLKARSTVPDALRACGAKVQVVEAYRTLSAETEVTQQLREELRAKQVDVITLTSPSTAEQLNEVVRGSSELLLNVALASIGPITTSAAEKLGLHVAVTADTYTTQGLVEALSDHFARAL